MGLNGFCNSLRQPVKEPDEEVKRRAFNRTLMEISNRLRIFLSLPLEKIDRMSLQQELRKLGEQ